VLDRSWVKPTLGGMKDQKTLKTKATLMESLPTHPTHQTSAEVENKGGNKTIDSASVISQGILPFMPGQGSGGSAPRINARWGRRTT
jgi:hypothetical protein